METQIHTDDWRGRLEVDEDTDTFMLKVSDYHNRRFTYTWNADSTPTFRKTLETEGVRYDLERLCAVWDADPASAESTLVHASNRRHTYDVRISTDRLDAALTVEEHRKIPPSRDEYTIEGELRYDAEHRTEAVDIIEAETGITVTDYLPDDL